MPRSAAVSAPVPVRVPVAVPVRTRVGHTAKHRPAGSPGHLGAGWAGLPVSRGPRSNPISERAPVPVRVAVPVAPSARRPADHRPAGRGERCGAPEVGRWILSRGTSGGDDLPTGRAWSISGTHTGSATVPGTFAATVSRNRTRGAVRSLAPVRGAMPAVSSVAGNSNVEGNPSSGPGRRVMAVTVVTAGRGRSRAGRRGSRRAAGRPRTTRSRYIRIPTLHLRGTRNSSGTTPCTACRATRGWHNH